MIPALIGAIAVSTAVPVGVTAWGVEEQKKQAEQGMRDQDKWTLLGAQVEYGTALLFAPSAVKV